LMHYSYYFIGHVRPPRLSLTYFIISRDIQEAISNASIITDKKLIYTTDIADKYRSSSEHKYKYVDKLTSKMIEHNFFLHFWPLSVFCIGLLETAI